MLLEQLIKNIKPKKIIGKIKNINISEISINSRTIKNNNLYIAINGEKFDGHSFIDEAIINGAIAVITEKEFRHYKIPQIIVNDTRKAMSQIASEFYGNPKNKLKFIGVTGTNGKTSTSLFISQILNSTGHKTACIGTLGIFVGDKIIENPLTTPDPLDFHKILKSLVEQDFEFVVMEVSAHAIALKKVCNINFEVGILTNITQDHLDFFGDMENYAKVKRSFILSKKVKFALVNADDQLTQKLLGKRKKLLTFGLHSPADVFAINVEKNIRETKFVMNLLDNIFRIKISLVGEFNIYNTMAASLACLCLGLKIEEIISGLKTLTAPTGRFNIISLPENKTVVLDFAHTPDSLEKILHTTKELCKGEVISLFGCGGDRDRSKRSQMGKISEAIADFTILTSDNPRFEKPEEILCDIEKGFESHNYLKITNREEAIKKGLAILKPNDILVICGKAGELYQDINGIKIPYSDHETVMKFFNKI